MAGADAAMSTLRCNICWPHDLDAACTLVADTAHEIMLQDPYQARRLLNLLPTAQLMRQRA
ncbi:MAG: hypothetical protein R2856_37080 [Caldilineaceae bacterium]